MSFPRFVQAICVSSVITIAMSATTAPSNILQCRFCNRATKLSECNTMVTCDATLEDCYMEELFTDQRTVVYNGGCRSKQLCSMASGKKRNDLVVCSRCCNAERDCNKRLCGIIDDTLNSSQCYSCDHRTSEQSEVKSPDSCVTLGTCQANEMCYTTQQDLQGADTFFYGCYSKQICSIIMEQAYEDWKLCEKNITVPASEEEWKSRCGNYATNTGGIGKRSNALCHSCCNYGGCNFGTCHEQNVRLFELALHGKLDIRTLEPIP